MRERSFVSYAFLKRRVARSTGMIRRFFEDLDADNNMRRRM
jgi:hypothetical protein